MQMKGKNIPPIAATDAIVNELVNVWGESPKSQDTQRWCREDEIPKHLPSRAGRGRYSASHVLALREK